MDGADDDEREKDEARGYPGPTAPGAPIGGLKVISASGWFAARPSGTEDVYKLYAESFRGPGHLAAIQEEAQSIIAAALGERAEGSGPR